MADALQVSRYLIHRAVAETEAEPDPLTHLRLQKLLYYVQMHSLAERGVPMFPERIEAWVRGPVVKDLHPVYTVFKKNAINASDVERARGLLPDELSLIDRVWNQYKGDSVHALIEKTHRELPWLEARGNLGPDVPCNNEITHLAMQEFGRRPKRQACTIPDEFEISAETYAALDAKRTAPDSPDF